MGSRHAERLLDEASEALIGISPDGIVRLWNRAAAQLFGRAADQTIGRPVDEALPLAQEDVGAQQLIAEAIARGGVTQAGAHAADGSLVDLQLSVVSDAHGDIDMIAGRARRPQVVGSGPAFRGLLEAAPDAMVIVDDSGRIRALNGKTERLFGYTRDELVGRMIEILVPDSVRDVHAELRATSCRGDGARRMAVAGLDLRGRHKDGSEFPAEIHLSPLSAQGGTVLCAAIRDISDRIRAETSQKLANQELEAFGYAVAHDLRAPLRSMSGTAAILLEKHATRLGADGIECLEEIRTSSLRMGALIDALLFLSRVTRSELRPDEVDFGALAREIGSRLERAQPGRSVRLVVQGGLNAYCDPRLARILMGNLLDNAWKFTGGCAAPRIEVGLSDRDGVRAIFVHDNGAGFDMNAASALFAPFQRLHAPGQLPGTGIGLAMARRIVHRHGGDIWAEGRIDQGAAFYFTLPAAPVEAAQR